MSAQWKRGDVALVHGEVCIRTTAGHWEHGNVSAFPHDGREPARPLLVIDPEDREQVERLRDALNPRLAFAANVLTNWQDGLRSLLTPPRPDEPRGLGAVVENAKSHKFVRVADWIDGWAAGRQWQRIGGELNAVRNFGWDAIDAVRVLSEGVQ